MTDTRTRGVMFAEVDNADKDRLHRLIHGQGLSVSQFMRGLINDHLEELGEPLLQPMGEPGRPRRST